MQTIVQKALADTIYYRNIPVFIYEINYPHFSTTCSQYSAYIINEYYNYFAEMTEVYCHTVLYPQALESVRYIQDNRPFNSYTLHVNYKITYNRGCITSLYMDTFTYMGGAHGETKRVSNTWDFTTGMEIQLNHIYPITPAFLYELQKEIGTQIAEQRKASPGSYFDNYQSLLLHSFNPESFYLLPGIFVIYFQQYDIAPYSSGIPEFSFPAGSHAVFTMSST